MLLCLQCPRCGSGPQPAIHPAPAPGGRAPGSGANPRGAWRPSLRHLPLLGGVPSAAGQGRLYLPAGLHHQHQCLPECAGDLAGCP